MARARNIKPKFFQNDELGELPPLARLLFIGMWTLADFKGCLEFRPKRIKTQILPYDDCDIELLSKNLDKSGFISIYSVQGQRYVKIIKFEKHQTPHKNEREAGSEIPDITEKDNEISELKEDGKNPDKNGTTPASNFLLNPSNCSLNPESTAGNPEPDRAVALAGQKPGMPVKADPVQDVFDYWRKRMSSPGSKLDKTRRKLIEGALKNYSPREICEAIKGCSLTPHNMGINDSNQKYNGLNIILRNADQIDRFIGTARAKPNGAVAGDAQTEEQYLADVQAALDKLNGHAPQAAADDPNIIDMENPDA